MTGDTGATPYDVIRRAAGLPGLAVLWGRWFTPEAPEQAATPERSVIILHSPTAELDALDADRAIERLAADWSGPDTGPRAGAGWDGASGAPASGRQVGTGLIGGGWLMCLGFTAQTSVLRRYDFLLRWAASTGWVFETLGLPGREAAVATERERWRRLLDDARPAGSPEPGSAAYAFGPFDTLGESAGTRTGYLAGVEEVIGRIDRGDFYQVNLCTRLAATFSGDPLAAFADVVAALDPAYGAYLDGRRPLLSLSPELFLRLAGGTVTTAPIKGTLPRTAPPEQLRASAKDVAENVMITDLMRNDLSRVCRPGTVAVERPLEVQAHPGVWHLVSTVRGELRPDAGPAELLAATFPPGSVTGAPKSWAVRAIAELEPQPRGRYTGAFGLLSPHAGLHLSVIIRTLELDPAAGRAELGVGGGITVDSVPVREWQECLDKAAPIAAASGGGFAPSVRAAAALPTPAQLAGGVFETLLARQGQVHLLAHHLARLDRSTRELYGSGLPDDLAGQVRRAAAEEPVPRAAVRVRAHPADGRLTWAVAVSPTPDRLSVVRLVLRSRSAGLWRHKWADRAELAVLEAGCPGALPYFADAAGNLAETARSNIFCLGADGVWRTPPLTDDVLPGVTRREVLDLLTALGVAVRVAPVAVAALRAAEAAFVTSSLSLATAVVEVDGRPLPREPAAAITALLNPGLLNPGLLNPGLLNPGPAEPQ